MFISGFQLPKIAENGEELVLSQKVNSYVCINLKGMTQKYNFGT